MKHSYAWYLGREERARALLNEMRNGLNAYLGLQGGEQLMMPPVKIVFFAEQDLDNERLIRMPILGCDTKAVTTRIQRGNALYVTPPLLNNGEDLFQQYSLVLTLTSLSPTTLLHEGAHLFSCSKWEWIGEGIVEHHTGITSTRWHVRRGNISGCPDHTKLNELLTDYVAANVATTLNVTFPKAQGNYYKRTFAAISEAAHAGGFSPKELIKQFLKNELPHWLIYSLEKQLD